MYLRVLCACIYICGLKFDTQSQRGFVQNFLLLLSVWFLFICGIFVCVHVRVRACLYIELNLTFKAKEDSFKISCHCYLNSLYVVYVYHCQDERQKDLSVFANDC